jgi:hypothetical protein
VRCWPWLFGNTMPISLLRAGSHMAGYAFGKSTAGSWSNASCLSWSFASSGLFTLAGVSRSSCPLSNPRWDVTTASGEKRGAPSGERGPEGVVLSEDGVAATLGVGAWWGS